MGKLKKSTTSDNKQTKISSFFQGKPAKPAESKLFSTVTNKTSSVSQKAASNSETSKTISGTDKATSGTNKTTSGTNKASLESDGKRTSSLKNKIAKSPLEFTKDKSHDKDDKVLNCEGYDRPMHNDKDNCNSVAANDDKATRNVTIVPETQLEDYDVIDFKCTSPKFGKASERIKTSMPVGNTPVVNKAISDEKGNEMDVCKMECETTPSKQRIDSGNTSETPINIDCETPGVVPPTPESHPPGKSDTSKTGNIPIKKLPPNRSFLPSVTQMSTLSSKMNQRLTKKKKVPTATLR